MKKVAILGSTGSIGRQALEVISKLQDKFEVTALAAGNNIDLLKEQIKNFNPRYISVKTNEHAEILKKEFPNKNIMSDGIIEISKNTKYKSTYKVNY